MKIFRLETDKKFGIYQSTAMLFTADQYSGDRTKHPRPCDDSRFNEECINKTGKDALRYGYSGSYVFGFSSPEQLLRWFYEEYDYVVFEEHSVRIAVYECDDVIVGNTQVAFSKLFHDGNEPMQVYLPTVFWDTFGKSGGALT